jgi:peptide/nickel transport system substrate-binding protein
VPNPNWWGAVPIDQASYKFFANTTSEALAFRAGEVGIVPSVDNPTTFVSTSGAKLIATLSCSNGFLSFNTQTPPWNNVYVRRAAAYAVNRSAIITALGGYAEPIYTLIPPAQLETLASSAQVTSLLNSLPLYRYSPSKARQELADSPYPDGTDATLLGDTYSSDENVDQVIVAELDAVGIHVQLKVDASYDGYLNIETGPDAKRATTYASYNGCFSPDPSNYDDFLGSQNLAPGQFNLADYAPQAVDRLISEGVRTTDASARFLIYSNLVRRLQTDLPYVGLYVTDLEIALAPNYTYSDYGPYSWVGPYLLSVGPSH